MRIVVTANAVSDISNIYSWIASDSVARASFVTSRIMDAIDHCIAPHPFIGKVGKIAGTREWVVQGLPYIVVYTVDTARETLTIAGVVHGARNR